MKMNISMDDELCAKMDEFIKKNYMTRSGFISMSVNNYLSQNTLMMMVEEMSRYVHKAIESGEVDPEDDKRMSDLITLAKALGVKVES